MVGYWTRKWRAAVPASARMTTPQELVVLVDTAGQEIGESVKADVHGTSTPLHLAFPFICSTNRVAY
jgi:hypothetical protein